MKLLKEFLDQRKNPNWKDGKDLSAFFDGTILMKLEPKARINIFSKELISDKKFACQQLIRGLSYRAILQEGSIYASKLQQGQYKSSDMI